MTLAPDVPRMDSVLSGRVNSKYRRLLAFQPFFSFQGLGYSVNVNPTEMIKQNFLK